MRRGGVAAGRRVTEPAGVDDNSVIEACRPLPLPRRPAEPAFLAAYPDFASTTLLDDLRATEYYYLDRRDRVYLDFAGAGVPADAQLRAHAERLRGSVIGDPTAAGPAADEAAHLIQRSRDAVLRFFNADPDEYCVIFTANATAACRLVGEAYPFVPGSRLVMTEDNHDSVIGLREFAKRARAGVAAVPLRSDLRLDQRALMRALRQGAAMRRHAFLGCNGLFAMPAQSAFSGVQHRLEWVGVARQYGYDVLVDAAAYAATNPLDLSAFHPDFTLVSWRKVFGYPAGVGSLIARHEALERLRRPWFAAGSTQAVSVRGDWALLSDDETAFEDGVPDFLSIPDVEAGITWVSDIGMDLISRRVSHLTGWLLQRLASLRHADRRPVIHIHGPGDLERRGGIVSFSVLDPYGDYVDERVIARDTAAAGITLRTGAVGNSGAAEAAFGVVRRTAESASRHEPATAEEYAEMLDTPVGSVVRVSLGLVSNLTDVERLVRFVEDTYVDRFPDLTELPPRVRL
jgi:selenocysteine lyase/cysteine desulfurase